MTYAFFVCISDEKQCRICINALNVCALWVNASFRSFGHKRYDLVWCAIYTP